MESVKLTAALGLQTASSSALECAPASLEEAALSARIIPRKRVLSESSENSNKVPCIDVPIQSPSCNDEHGLDSEVIHGTSTMEWEPEDDMVSYSPVDFEEITSVDFTTAMEATVPSLTTELHAEAVSSPPLEKSIEKEFVTPLYENARITVGVSLLLVMSFVIKHGLTDAALQDLLSLISFHCPLPNLCITTLYSFKKYFVHSRIQSRRHYYCSSCLTAFTSELDVTCPNPACKQESSSKCFFVELSIVEQLKRLFKKPGFYLDLQHRFHRQKLNPDVIADVYDGKLYRAHMHKDGFLSNPNNISFQWNTDGVSLFHSSNYHMWPLYLKINELPVRKRICITNKLMAGIWFGESKPSVNTFFKPAYDVINKIFKDGIIVTSPDVHGPFKCRSMLLSGTCDIPAKAVVLNMIGHNGFYGCPKCLQPGETTNTARGHVHTYPFKAENPIGPTRTANNVKADAKAALQKNSTVHGIKSGSCLLSLSHYDIVRGTGIDYMHCVLLNVVKLLLSLWFDPTYSSQPWSCTRSVSVVNLRMESIQPPNLISRIPRGISKRKFWKASEYRSWLFLYSLPVMMSVLPSVYYEHYVLLCEAIYILNTTTISRSDLHRSSKLIQHFYYKFPAMYSQRYLSCNMHQLLHLPMTVEELGPLFSTSCFDHEDTNGKLARMVHCHSSIDSQIVSSFSTLQKLVDLASNYLDHDEEEYRLFTNIISKKRPPKFAVQVNDECAVIGAQTQVCDDALMQLFEDSSFPVTTSQLLQFGRLILRGEVFHSKLYRRPSRQNSYTVLYSNNEQGENFGLISSFFLYIPECHHSVESACHCRKQVFAAIHTLSPNTDPKFKLSHDHITGATVPHIIPCHPPSEDLTIINVTVILEKVVYMSFPDVNQCVYVAKLPNTLESD